MRASLKLELESAELIAVFDKYINRNYGVRCDEFEPECCVCRIWKMRDDLKTFVE
jgi:hypothetical protein